jgi:hypothetical protein
VIGLALVAAACGGVNAARTSAHRATYPDTTSTSLIEESIPSSAPAPTNPPRTCTSEDLRGVAEWQAGAMPVGGVPGARRFAREMEGLVHVINTSHTACLTPEAFSARLVAVDGRSLGLRSVMRSFEQAPYHWKGPLAPGASAAAPFMWEPSWCGPDPGTSPTLALTLTPEKSPLMVRVDLVHGEFGHLPACDRALASSDLVFAPFRQA